MLKQPEAEVDPRALALGSLLAALAPLFAALACASAYPLGAGGERVLAAGLGFAQAAPPGYPLATLVARLCALLPLGPLALRVGLGSAVLHAVAAAALFRAIDRGLRAQEGLRPLLASPLALGVTLLAFGCAPLFADVAQAHAAALALACLCLDRLVAFEVAWPRLALGPLRAAALLFALLVPEQPALAAVLFVAALPSLRRLFAAFRLPGWNLSCLMLGLPLFLYAGLAGGRELGLPVARSPLEMLRAAFAGAEAATRWATPALAAAQLVPFALAALAALGGVVALRVAAHRRIGGLWLIVGLTALAAANLLPHGRAHAALGLCSAAALSALALCVLLAGHARARLALAASVVAVVLGASQLQAATRGALALDHAASDALAGALRRDLPVRSALLLGPDLASAFLDAEGEERTRPDLLVALPPWLLDLASAKRVAARHPELLPLLRAELLNAPQAAAPAQAALPLVELATLAARRPLLLELEPVRGRPLHATVVPFAFHHQVSTSEVSKSDVDLAARDAEYRISTAYAELDPSRLDSATLALLTERHCAELDHALSLRDGARGARALERLERLVPEREARERLLAVHDLAPALTVAP